MFDFYCSEAKNMERIEEISRGRPSSPALHVQRIGVGKEGGTGSCGLEGESVVGGRADSALLIDESG